MSAINVTPRRLFTILVLWAVVISITECSRNCEPVNLQKLSNQINAGI